MKGDSMSEHVRLGDIVEVKTASTEGVANEYLQEGWILLDVKIQDIRRGPNFTDWATQYILGRPKPSAITEKA